MNVLLPNNDTAFPLGPTIGMGGYGRTHDWASGEDVAKVTEVYLAKLEYLIANRLVPTRIGHRYAWPYAIIRDATTGQPCGCVMQKAVDGIDTERLFSPVPLPKWIRVRVATNHVHSLIDLEAAGYRRGDFPNSLFHQDGSITEVDLDSLQINHPGATFNGGNVKAITAPPEVLEHFRGGGEPGFETTREHDAWSIAVLIWLILMQGEHPFDAVPVGPGAAADIDERTRAGHWPHDPNCLEAEPRPGSRPLTDLEPTLQSLFRQTFVDGHPNRDPRNRPTIQAWAKVLEPIDALTP